MNIALFEGEPPFFRDMINPISTDRINSYRDGLKAYEAIEPATLPGNQGIDLLGEELMKFVQVQTAAITKVTKPQPCEREQRLWSGSALKSPDLMYVVRQIFERYDLWTDKTLRAFVPDHLFSRTLINLLELDQMRRDLYPKISQGQMGSQEQAQRFVRYHADNLGEAYGQRYINIFQRWSIYASSEYYKPHFLSPKAIMDKDLWGLFLQTQAGFRLGVLSCVDWYIQSTVKPRPTENPTPYQESLRECNRLTFAALAPYLDEPDYRAYSSNPNDTINDAVITFRQTLDY